METFIDIIDSKTGQCELEDFSKISRVDVDTLQNAFFNRRVNRYVSLPMAVEAYIRARRKLLSMDLTNNHETTEFLYKHPYHIKV